MVLLIQQPVGDLGVFDRWVAEDWPRIKQTPTGAEPAWSSSTRARSA